MVSIRILSLGYWGIDEIERIEGIERIEANGVAILI
jgi:hypothetical protein